MLQHHAEARSTDDCKISVIRSPKCHPEIAGEGIEYDWAGAKSYYRRSCLSKKKEWKSLKSLVVESLKSVGFGQRVSFSAKAREYMLAYDVLAAWEELPEEWRGGNEELPPGSASLLDGIVNKRRKSHRSVGKQEAWVKRIMNAMKERDVIVVS